MSGASSLKITRRLISEGDTMNVGLHQAHASSHERACMHTHTHTHGSHFKWDGETHQLQPRRKSPLLLYHIHGELRPVTFY